MSQPLLIMARGARLEFFCVVTGVTPIDGGFRHIFLRYQRYRMGFMAPCTDRDALFVFPVVRHIVVGIYLLAAFRREVLRPGGEIIEGTVTLEADILVPGWGRRSLRLLLIRRLGHRQSCHKKVNEYKNQEGPYGRHVGHGNILSLGGQQDSQQGKITNGQADRYYPRAVFRSETPSRTIACRNASRLGFPGKGATSSLPQIQVHHAGDSAAAFSPAIRPRIMPLFMPTNSNPPAVSPPAYRPGITFP